MSARTGLRLLLGVIYFGVGLFHLVRPEVFLPIMPEWVPAPRELVLLTGVWELAGAAGLLWPSPRPHYWAGIAMAVYAVAVYPANLKHALDGVALGGEVLGWAYHGPRLVFQPVFVWWALWACRIIDWPFRQDP